MDMSGEYRIAAPQATVWAALNDPDILRRSIEGCEEIVKTSDTEFTAKVTAKVGPVKARFGGKVTLSNLNPPHGYTITGEGSGGVAGFAKGGAEVTLEADGPATILRYTVAANVGGKLAQIGSRLIDGTARKMADNFFSTFSTLVAADAPTDGNTPTAPSNIEAASEPASAPLAGGITDTGFRIAPPAPPAVTVAPMVRTVEPAPGTPSPATQTGMAGNKGISPYLWGGGIVLSILIILWLLMGA